MVLGTHTRFKTTSGEHIYSNKTTTPVQDQRHIVAVAGCQYWTVNNLKVMLATNPWCPQNWFSLCRAPGLHQSSRTQHSHLRCSLNGSRREVIGSTCNPCPAQGNQMGNGL